MGWAVFAVVDLNQLKILIQRMFTLNNSLEWLYYIRNYGITFIIAGIFSTPLISNLYKKIVKSEVINTIVLIIILLLCIAYLVDASYNPFLYFRF